MNLIVPQHYHAIRSRELLSATTSKALSIASALAARVGLEESIERFDIEIQRDSRDGKWYWCVWYLPRKDDPTSAQLAAQVEFVEDADPDLDAMSRQLRLADRTRHGAQRVHEQMMGWQDELRDAAAEDSAVETGGEFGEYAEWDLGRMLGENNIQMTDGLRKRTSHIKRRKVIS